MAAKNGNGKDENTAQLSKAQIKALFATYADADAAVELARKGVDEAIAERSKAVQEIAESVGKGPFSFQGRVLTAASRTNKKTGETTHFFKSPSQSEMLEI